MKKAALLATFFIFYYIFATHSASALGIAPGRVEMNFMPGYENEFTGYVSSSNQEDIEMYVDGELKDYITLLTPDRFTIYPDKPVAYTFRVKLPETLERPGRHVGYIWAMQHVEAQPGVAIARVKVGTTVRVNVPYPGKYAEIAFTIKNPNVNDTIVFEIGATNLGKENITQAKGEIEILDQANDTLVMLQTEGKPIETTKTETLQATWFSNVAPGLYRAKVRVLYDGETAGLEREFNIGAPLIKIINASAEPIINGTIGKILTKIRSYWNDEIKDAYLEVFIKDMAGKPFAQQKSENVNVGAFDAPVITSFWDTSEGVPLGNYTGLAVLHYLGTNDTKEFGIEVIAKPYAFASEWLLIIAVVIAGAAVVVFLVFLARRMKHKNKFAQKKLM